MAKVVITPEAQKQYQAFPTAIRSRIEKIFVRLKQWPAVSGAKSLSGNLAGHYRIRTGDYRVQFRVAQRELAGSSHAVEQVTVEKVGHRDKFYKE